MLMLRVCLTPSHDAPDRAAQPIQLSQHEAASSRKNMCLHVRILVHSDISNSLCQVDAARLNKEKKMTHDPANSRQRRTYEVWKGGHAASTCVFIRFSYVGHLKPRLNCLPKLRHENCGGGSGAWRLQRCTLLSGGIGPDVYGTTAAMFCFFPWPFWKMFPLQSVGSHLPSWASAIKNEHAKQLCQIAGATFGSQDLMYLNMTTSYYCNWCCQLQNLLYYVIYVVNVLS